MTKYFCTAFCVGILAAVLSWSAGAQTLSPYAVPRYESPTIILPFEPIGRAPSMTIVNPPPPSPRVDVPYYVPPSRTVICMPVGTITVCQ